MNTGDFDSIRISHAYIVSPNMVEAVSLAALCGGGDGAPCRVCAHCDKVLRGIHPDIMTTEPRTQEVVVDQIRALHKDVYTVPNEAAKKVYVITPADSMNAAAQNALLRILEEPPGHTVFILSTLSPQLLLPTVRSRCVLLRSMPEDAEHEETVLELVSDFFSAIEGGAVPLMEFMFKLEKQSRDYLPGFIDAARAEIAARLRVAGGVSPKVLVEAEAALRQAGEYLDLNVSAGYVAGMVCARLLVVDD